MPWRMEHTKNCRCCGRERHPGEVFSARGKCTACGIARMGDNLTQLVDHRGPWFQHWRREMARCVGAVLADE